MHAPDYFGEAAMLGRGVRHAAAIADSAVEVLVLLKLDFDLKIDAETRDILNVLVSQYPKDATFIKYAPFPPPGHNNMFSFVMSDQAILLDNWQDALRHTLTLSLTYMMMTLGSLIIDQSKPRSYIEDKASKNEQPSGRIFRRNSVLAQAQAAWPHCVAVQCTCVCFSGSCSLFLCGIHSICHTFAHWCLGICAEVFCHDRASLSHAVDCYSPAGTQPSEVQCRDMAKKSQWEKYKQDTVKQVLVSANKEHLMTQYSDCLFDQPWRP